MLWTRWGLHGLGELFQPQEFCETAEIWGQPGTAGSGGEGEVPGGQTWLSLIPLNQEVSKENLKSGLNASVGLELEGCGSWLCQPWVEPAGA